jgi:hypothetical protein
LAIVILMVRSLPPIGGAVKLPRAAITITPLAA